MKTVFAFVAAATLSAASFAGPAQEVKQVRSGPLLMSEAQMDHVTAGAVQSGLINVDVSNVANNNDVRVNIPINANAAVVLTLLGKTSGEIVQGITSPGRER